MDLSESESDAQSFIVKVWIEDRAEETGLAVWRGRITHIPSGTKRYLKNLDEVRDFIAPYLEDMGVKFGLRWWIRSWLKHLIGRS